MARLGQVILGVVVVGILVGVLGSVEVGTRRSFTCVLCRLDRCDTMMFGVVRSSLYENECSRWYRANVEPSHAHVWEPGTCTTLLNVFGQPMGVGCRPGHYPIRLLPPATQMRVYQHISDRRNAKDLFANLTDAKTHDDRLDEHDESKGHLIVRAIEEWENAGFPDTWEAWWKRWWDKHVAEHKEWLVWLHSDSGLNFWDWQAQRRRKPALHGPEGDQRADRHPSAPERSR
jgi:hypothetical protein